jgi:hypothetical protein
MNQPHKPALKTIPPFSAACVLVFFLPWLVKLLFGLPWLMLQNFTDGVFYLGYAMHFRELIDRVGLTYYAVRFSGIAPDALAFSLFGVEAGLVVVRYGLAGACCAALLVLFSRRYGKAAGWFAAFAWAFNPAAIRLLQTAYVDVAGASFLCLGLCLICLPEASVRAAFVGGICLGMTFWSHLHAAVALVFFGPLLLLVLQERTIREAWLFALALLAGGTLMTLAGVAFFYLNYGLWDLTSPTRELLQTLKDGHIPAPKLDWIEVAKQCPFWLSVLPLGVGLFFLPKRDRFLYACFFAFAGYIAFLLWGDLVKGGYSLSLFYYFSFALPAFVFLVAALVANLGRDVWRMAWALIFPVLAVACNPSGSVAFLGASFVTSLLPAALPWRFSRTALAASLSLASFAVALAPASKLALGHYWKSDDLPLLTMFAQLSKALPKYQEDPGKLVFWYDDSKGDDLRMLQSFYLHEFTKLKRPDGENLEFPPSVPIDKESILRAGLRHIVVLGASTGSTEPAIKMLRDVGLPIREIKSIPLQAPGHALQATVVSFHPPAFVEKSSLVPDWKLHRQATLSLNSIIQTGSKKGRLDAALSMPPLSPGDAACIKLRVLEGAVRIGLAPTGSSALPTHAPLVSPTFFGHEILLFPPKTGEPSSLQIRNAAPRGVPSKILVEQIKTIRLSDPPKVECSLSK